MAGLPPWKMLSNAKNVLQNITYPVNNGQGMFSGHQSVVLLAVQNTMDRH
jgi:hypothetical protein